MDLSISEKRQGRHLPCWFHLPPPGCAAFSKIPRDVQHTVPEVLSTSDSAQEPAFRHLRQRPGCGEAPREPRHLGSITVESGRKVWNHKSTGGAQLSFPAASVTAAGRGGA